jgi:rsbT co-antagonist protein RsbR
MHATQESPFDQLARRHYPIYLHYVIATTFLFGALEVGGGLLIDVPALIVVGVSTLTLCAACVVGRWLFMRALSAPGVAVISGGCLLSVVAYMAAMPELLPISVILLMAAAVTPVLFRSGRLFTGVGIAVVLTALVLLGMLFLPPRFPAPAQPIGLIAATASFPVCTVLMVLMFRFIWQTLHASLDSTAVVTQELQALKDSLAQQVAMRTADLERALGELEARSAAQAQLVSENELQRQTILKMSVPVLPVRDGTLIMPLVGAVDGERLRNVQEEALHAIERMHSRRLLIDITGVPLVDAQVAHALVSIVQTARLLGATVTLVGVRPEVAQAIVGLGLDLRELHTSSDLQSALGG